MEPVTSEEHFQTACPCAALIATYVSELLAGQDLKWAFGKAIVRPTRTSAMFVCVDANDDAHELWVSAASVAPGEWALKHSPLPVLGR